MKRCLKITTILTLAIITSGCANEAGYNLIAKGQKNGSNATPIEQLNPSAVKNYSWYSFYLRDQLTAARDTCPGKTWCENRKVLDAIDIARRVLGRAYGPPVGSDSGGVYQLAHTLKDAEMALYGKTTVKDVHRYE